jgi:hypothetical protein
MGMRVLAAVLVAVRVLVVVVPVLVRPGVRARPSYRRPGVH